MAEIYRQKVMELYRRPHNYGKIIKPTKVFKGANPFCGDALEIFIRLDKNGKIKEARWEGSGCVISQVAASILTEMIKGKNLDQVKKMTADKFIKKLKLELSPMRRKCALLALYTLKEVEVK